MSKKKSKRRTKAASSASHAKSGTARKADAAGRTPPPPPVDLQLKKELYFPTHIYFCDLPGAEKLNAQLVRDIRALRDADPEGIVRSNVKSVGSWHSATNLNQHPKFLHFTTHLDDLLNGIYRDLGYHPDSRAVCDNMWANINPRFGYNRFHTHPNVLWSGVYYVQVTPDSGRIYFRDPREQANAIAPSFPTDQERIRELWSEVYYEPIAGRVIVFPGWLGHEIQPNLTTLEGEAGERISISFNYVQRTEIPTR